MAPISRKIISPKLNFIGAPGRLRAILILLLGSLGFRVIASGRSECRGRVTEVAMSCLSNVPLAYLTAAALAGFWCGWALQALTALLQSRKRR